MRILKQARETSMGGEGKGGCGARTWLWATNKDDADITVSDVGGSATEMRDSTTRDGQEKEQKEEEQMEAEQETVQGFRLFPPLGKTNNESAGELAGKMLKIKHAKWGKGAWRKA